jgi:hypothetical protein
MSNYFTEKVEEAKKAIGNKLGDDSNNRFCGMCGANTIDGICPRCTPAAALPADPDNKFKNHLFNPTEKIVCVLGNTYLQNFLTGGSVSQGFSVVSDKRVYFRGKVFEAIGNKLHRTKVSTAVNIRDVTGVSVTNVSPIHYIILGVILVLAGLVLIGVSGWLLLAGLVLGAVNFLLYFLKRITLLKIQYAGGVIGFDIKWFPDEESLTYQRALFLTKDKMFEDA